MESYIIDVNDKKGSEALLALAKRPDLRARKLNAEAYGDLALAKAIDEGHASGHVDEQTVKETLREAVHEVKLNKEGKIKLRPLKDVLDEL